MTYEHPVWVEISRSAYRHNLDEIRKRVGPRTAVLAVVKANAYGHGLSLVARLAVEAGVPWLGVTSVLEGLILRNAGLEAPILVLGPCLDSEIETAARARLSLVLTEPTQLEIASIVGEELRSRVRVHLKFDTGMSRRGLRWDRAFDLIRQAKQKPGIVLEGVATHFATADEPADTEHFDAQLARFREIDLVLQTLGCEKTIRHVSGSAAALLHRDARFDMVRIGISSYGLWPSDGARRWLRETDPDLSLRPVLSFRTRIAEIHELPAGTGVSYGITESVSSDARVAVLPVGYWDGFDRGLSSKGEVLVRGKRARVVGRVCMNMIVIDITGIDDVMREDEVVLIGRSGDDEITADEVAERLGTINYEIVTRVNPVLPRVEAA